MLSRGVVAVTKRLRLRDIGWVFHRRYLGGKPRIVCLPEYGLALGLYPGEHVSDRLLAATFKVEACSFVRRFLAPGMILFDVGANLGVYTVIAGMVLGKQGCVHSFEPLFREFNRLRRNVQLNDLDNVVLNRLAVEDAAFQKKCLGRMGNVAREGRTVLFVSHNMAAVESLCSRAILLMQGSMKVSGFPRSVIASYLTSVRQEECMHDIRNRDNRRGTGAIRFVGFHLEDADGNVLEMVRTGQDVTFVFSYESSIREIDRHVVVSFAISNMYGASLILHRTNFTGQDFKIIPPIGQFKCAIPKLPLVAGRYGITGCVQIGSNIADLVEEMSYLNVVEGDFFGTGHYGWPEHSPFLIDGRWFVVPSHS